MEAISICFIDRKSLSSLSMHRPNWGKLPPSPFVIATGN